MKKIDNILRRRRSIVFLDFEGTQRTGEMIALGGVLTTLNRDGTIKKFKEPLKLFVKASSPVGTFVQKLTGITDELLEKQGVSFADAMMHLRKYVGLVWRKCLFCTFGNNDMRILNSSISHNIKSPLDLCHQIHVNYFDFESFIETYIKDDKGNAMSLVHLCELFNVELAGTPHDPSVDAINLANLYNAFLIKKDIVLEQYTKRLIENKKYPDPIKGLMKSIKDGNSVNLETLKEEVKKDIA